MTKFDEHWKIFEDISAGNATKSEKMLATAFYKFGVADAQRQILDSIRSEELVAAGPPLVASAPKTA